MSEQRKNENRPPMGGGPRRGPGGPHGPMMVEKPKNAKGTLKRLLGFMRGNLGLLILVMVMSVFTAVISIVTTRLYGTVIDDYIAVGNMDALWKIAAVLLGIYLVNTGAVLLQNTKMVEIAQQTSRRLRKSLFDGIQTLPVKFFDTHSSGDIMSRLTNDVDTISNTLSQNIAQLFSGIINIVGTLIAMIALSPLLTLISMITIPFMLIITRVLASVMRKLYKKQQQDLGAINGYIEEMVSGQKVVKLFSREGKVKARFGEMNNALRRSGTKAEIVGGVMGPVMNLVNNLSYLVVAVAGGYLILTVAGANTAFTGVISVGVVFSFLMYMKNFGRPLSEIANMFNTIQSALAAAERVFEIMDETPEQDVPGADKEAEIQGDIRFDDVTFSYVEGTQVLKNASIDAKQGQQIAIVGPTGAGKTTIISLLTRFYDADSGLITVDGKRIDSLSRDCVRRNVGMVLQDSYLFSESVRDNIRYARPDATDEEIIAAAKMANAHSFIKHLPQGYDTILTDNGGNISQGQRQLLAIARAILADPHVLILDEATSSIDTRTELKIQEAMLKLMEGRTSFIIAHRLSTIKNADKIIVINKGQVVETGTHTELLQADGFYANLYNSQFKTGMAI